MRSVLYLLFAVGIVVKLLHLPYHTVLLLIVIAALLGKDLADLLARRTERGTGFALLAVTGWLLHLVAMLKLLPFRMFTGIAAGGLTLLALVVALRNINASRAAQAGLLLIALSVLLVQLAPVSTRYHFTNLRYSVERGTDVLSWDKYSYLLLRDGKPATALDANDSARAAAERSGERGLLDDLAAHRRLLQQRDWPRYHAPGHGP